MLMPLLLLSFLITSCSSQVASNFSFPLFDSRSCGDGGKLNCMGSATSGNKSLSITSSMQMTTDPSSVNQVGRVLYRYLVLAWPASFSTTFTIRILPDPDSLGTGDGMAFILAQDSSPSPRESYGSFIGIFDQSTEGVLHQLAVEFDTYKNEFDPDANHIAIDTKSIEDPVAVKSLNTSGIYLTSGREIAVKIEYDGWRKNLQIYVSYFGQPLMSFLNHTLKLKGTVPSSVYVGFTAATGTLCETHQVLAWDFESTELPKASLGREKKVVVMIVFPVIALFLILSLLASPYVVGMRRRRRESAAKEKEISLLIAAANGPKLFSYKKLSKATGKFSKDNLLGSGGFGSVYKGVVANPPSTIAVKKISSTSKQGEKEYLAEICTIGRLTHKNLLQLQGWCHDRDQLLLVYNYMPNGSLDRFIGKRSPFLIWPTRYKILQGLASALLYLHEECGTPVVHRDVKPNNVMLDSNYHAHLGDFGLARLLPEEAAVTTMIAGTLGYLAPEVSFTGRATTESDVYSFGVVVLEVVCGRRTKGIMEENGLVDGAWNLYEQGKLLECADKLLEGKFDEEEVRRTLVVGLACLNPDYTNRPTMRKVVQVFMNRDEPLMNLPRCRPMSVSLSFNSAASSRSSNFGCGNIVNGGGGSTMSYSSSSSQDGSRVPI